jgi:hypothetical protein
LEKRGNLSVGEKETLVNRKNNIPVQVKKILSTISPFYGAITSFGAVLEIF